MTIRITDTQWTGLEGIGDDMLKEMKPKAERLMWQAGTDFQTALKLKLSEKPSGRTYKVSKTGRMHVASAPGEPPAVLFGALRNSMGFSKPKWERWVLSMEVGSGLGVGGKGKISPAYARRLEFGGIDSRGINIKKRPYMAPVALDMDPKIQRLFEARL